MGSAGWQFVCQTVPCHEVSGHLAVSCLQPELFLLHMHAIQDRWRSQAQRAQSHCAIDQQELYLYHRHKTLMKSINFLHAFGA